MKTIILSLLLAVLSFTGFAHGSGIEIYNHSTCTVYIQMLGSKVCNCGGDYKSNIIVVPPLGNAIFTSTLTLGGTFPNFSPVYVHSAAIISGSLQCGNIQTWVIGEPGCGFTNTTTFFSQDQNCQIACQQLNAFWIPANPSCTGMSRLVIIP